MADKKLTDDELIKALEIHLRISNAPCGICAYYKFGQGFCINKLNIDALYLINRQKAEIEKKDKKIEELSEVLSDTIRIRYAEAKAEAYKECIEKVQEQLAEWVGADNSINYFRIKKVCDNLLKELVGEGK